MGPSSVHPGSPPSGIGISGKGEIGPKGEKGERYAIFLRGVNVGGITVRMADLRELLGTLPLQDVATVLASGNAVCRTELSAADLTSRTEEALRRRFGYEAWVIVTAAAELREVVDSAPAPPPGEHAYVTLFSTREALAVFLEEAAEVTDAAGAADRPTVLDGGIAVAWSAPKGRSTEVPLAKLLARKRYSSTTTTRNVATLTKVLGLLERAGLGGPG